MMFTDIGFTMQLHFIISFRIAKNKNNFLNHFRRCVILEYSDNFRWMISSELLQLIQHTETRWKGSDFRIAFAKTFDVDSRRADRWSKMTKILQKTYGVSYYLTDTIFSSTRDRYSMYLNADSHLKCFFNNDSWFHWEAPLSGRWNLHQQYFCCLGNLFQHNHSIYQGFFMVGSIEPFWFFEWYCFCSVNSGVALHAGPGYVCS